VVFRLLLWFCGGSADDGQIRGLAWRSFWGELRFVCSLRPSVLRRGGPLGLDTAIEGRIEGWGYMGNRCGVRAPISFMLLRYSPRLATCQVVSPSMVCSYATWRRVIHPDRPVV